MNQIDGLHPAIKPLVDKFLKNAKDQGIDLMITAGLRTFDEQNILYAQGRTTDGKIITKAKAGQSFHNYGLAVDVVPIVNKKADWNSKLWGKIGEIGESVGFEWGGRWKFIDKPHFQYPRNTRYTHLMQLKEDGKVDNNGYVIL